ncbi:MAG TPA: alpha/beta hydrolase [Myxococcota bacterium]
MRPWLALALVVAAVGVSPLFFQRIVERVLFQPSPGVDFTPEALGIAAETLWLQTQDGVRLHAFFLPGPPGTSRAILFLHGNAGNASHRLPNAAALRDLGAHVLLLDYRGYGLSEGRPSERGVCADARAALAHLIETRGVREARVVLFGRSLGGAVALDLAQDRRLGGVILESTFTSLRDMARGVIGPLADLLVRSGFESVAKIARVRAPLLFFHGDRDSIVPYELGLRLYEAAPEPKAFETIRGADHNDTLIVGGRAYFERIHRFLDEVTPD